MLFLRYAAAAIMPLLLPYDIFRRCLCRYADTPHALLRHTLLLRCCAVDAFD